MNKIFNAVKIFIAGIFLFSTIFIGSQTAAAEDLDDAQDELAVTKAPVIDEKTMQLFRETVMQTSINNDRVFHQDIYFVLPKLSGNLEFLGATFKDSLKVKGEFEFWMIDDKGSAEDLDIPFYVDQNEKNMVFYYQTDKKWKKLTAPTSAATVTDVVTTPNAEEVQKMMAFIKDVTILQDNDRQRTFLVKVDGAKIADALKVETDKDSTEQADNEDETLKTFLGYIDNGLRAADFWYTWTVDKNTWQTSTLSFNFSNLVQSIATVALNDPSQNWEGLEPIQEMLETVAFYSDFKAYTTFLNSDAKAQLEIPKNVLKAKEVKNLFDDDKSKKK